MPYKGNLVLFLCVQSLLVVVILEADKLSKEAQHGLRRTMEKYSSNLRLILCAKTAGKIINPIKSRCMILRVPGISMVSMSSFLQKICTKEAIQITHDSLQNVALTSSGNMRKALLMLESITGKYDCLNYR